MTEAEAVAQTRLDIVVKVMEILRNTLQGIDETLPPSPQELSQEEPLGTDPDVTSEVRRVVQCVLADRIDPALYELRKASLYKGFLLRGETRKRTSSRKARRKKDARKSRKA